MNKPKFSEVIDMQDKLKQVDLSYWLHHTFLTYQWWLLLAVTILPWVVWAFVSDRRKDGKFMANGLYVMVITSLLDTLGSSSLAWGYPFQLVPFLPRALAFDLGLLPVVYMVICKYFRDTRSFVIALFVAAAILSFVGEPLLVKLGIYQPFSWMNYYSFPIYIVIGLLGRVLLRSTRPER